MFRHARCHRATQVVILSEVARTPTLGPRSWTQRRTADATAASALPRFGRSVIIHRRFAVLVLLILAAGARVWGQVAAGVPPFSSLSGASFDNVNNANLNVHFEIPVINKAGRGLSFSYGIAYSSAVWYPVGATGSQTWAPVINWGWGASTQALGGYLSYNTFQHTCHVLQDYSTRYDNFVYHDALGTPHYFPLTIYDGGCGTSPTSGSATATDGSGYFLYADSSDLDFYTSVDTSVTSRAGVRINPLPLQAQTGAATVADTNGNKLSTDGTNFYDTLSSTTAALTVTGAAPNPTYFAYTNPSDGSSRYTMSYTSYNVKTNFGCSNIGEYTASTVPLVSSISLPDGTSYSLAYEPTPGYSGYVTGRLHSVTLPTGGTITYTYSGSNNGITCADGSTATLTRTTPDGAWTYAHTENGTAWATTVTDPQGNQTAYNFQGIYETERKIYQGTSTLLATIDTCYNGAAIPCTATAVNLPIANRTVQATIPGLSPAKTYTAYNSYGLPTEVDEYDYGPALLRKTLTSYASLAYNIVDHPASVTVQNASPTTVAQTSYGYDTHGNLLTETRSTGGTPATVSRSFTYNSNGTVATAKDFNGNQTTFNYGSNSCSAFPDSVSLPLSLSTSAVWNCNGAVPTSTTDANGQTTSYAYDNLWRLHQTTLPPTSAGTGQTTVNYYDTQGDFSVSASQLLTGSTWHQTTQVLDSLGRVKQGQDNSAGTYVDTGYDSLGHVLNVSNPYVSTSDPTYGVTTYAYDALGRVTQTTYPDSNHATVSYSGNCATATDPASKSRTLCSDALGRLTSVTEDPGTGHLNYSTTYTYNALDNLTAVTQGGQTRTYNYDMLSRLTSATTPESGTTSYYYTNSNGAICSGDSSAACRRTDARGITTTYAYDTLSRLKSKSYSDGTPAVNFWYDYNSATFGNWTQGSLTNTKGRLYATCTSNAVLTCPAGYTGTVYSYDSVGHIVNYWQATPYNEGSSAWQMTYNYDLAGDVTSWTHPAGFTITNSVNAAEQITQIQSSLVDSTHPQYLAQSITYTPWGATKTLINGCAGSGCTEVQETYDYNNRLQPVRIQLGTASNNAADYCLVYNYYSGSNPASCSVPSPGTGNNGNVMGYWYQDNVNPSSSHTASDGYDAVNRLASAVAKDLSSNTLWSQGYNYTSDGSNGQYGNVTCSVGYSGYCSNLTFDGTSNRIHQISGLTAGYDAAGDLTGDGTHSYQWDAEARLASEDGGTTETITYNALGKQARMVSQGTTIDLLSDPAGTPLGVNGSYSLMWTLPGHRPVIYYVGGDAEFFHANVLGSTTMETNASGAVSEDLLFYPWGPVWALAGTGGYNFASIPYRDVVSGLDLAQFRDYSYGLGRWMSPDPLGGDLTNPQSLNRYAYAMNNPTTLTDPLGLQANNFGFNGVECRDPTYADSHAECQGPGSPWCFLFPTDYGAGCGDLGGGGVGAVGGSGGGKGGGSSTGGSQRWPGNASFPNGVTVCATIMIPGSPPIVFSDPSCTTSNFPVVVAGSAAGVIAALRVLLNRPWMISWIVPAFPEPPAAGIGPAGSLAYNPATKTACGSLGVGLSAGHNLAVGPLWWAKMWNGTSAFPSNVNQILGGWSTSGGANGLGGVGAQGMINGAGAAAGPTLGVPGFSAAETYAVCVQLP